MRRFLSMVAVLPLLAAAEPAGAQQAVLGTTANPAPAAAFLADQQGIFKKHGLDLTVQILTADPTIPAALLSDSIQLASVTPTTFLNAVANGIDMVALTGTAITTHQSKDIAIVASKASGITDAKGFEGKTIAIPGIGAVLDVMLKAWLDQHGVQASTVKFIEMPLPMHADQLKAGGVDGAITVDQFAQRMLGEGFAVLVANPLTEIPEGQVAQVIVAMRGWADANPQAVAAVRASMAEATELAKADPTKLRAALGAAMKLPPPVIEKIALPALDVSINAAQFDWWLALMKKQGLVSAEVDTSALIQP